MRVVCDNCSAVYKIPDEKLVKPVNKATCRNCGHRMLIPRPTTADEERTLVSNNPLTPAGAVPRGGTPTDEPEQTLPVSLRNKAAARNAAPPPGRRVAGDSLGNSVNYADMDDDVPLMPGTPSPANDRSGRPPRPRRGHRGKQPEEKTSWVRSTPPPQAPAHVSYDADQLKDSEQPTRINPNPLTPEPAPPRAQDIDPSRDRAPVPAPAPAPAAAPAPAPVPAPAPSNPYPMPGTNSSIHHNPSGDLFLALLGIVASLLFTAMVGLNVSFGSYALDTLFQSLTLLVAFAGGFTAMFVIITGSRGRKPARQAVSILLSVLLALLCVSVIQGVKYTAVSLTTGTLGATVAAPAAPPADASIASTVPETEPETDGTDGTAEASSESTTKPATPKPRSNRRSSTSSSSSSSRSTPQPTVSAPPPDRRRVTVPSTPPPADDGPLFQDDEPLFDDDPPTRSAPPPPPPSSSAANNSGTMDAVPMEVIDVMLRNNIDVKKCFFTYMQSAGALPPRVDVRFTLEPTGRVSSAGVTQAQFAGTALDSCLGSAIKTIQFPPTTGPARKITFPYIFQ